ncbi:hypothetical protein [Streptomyces sp. NPDC059893]|uniref:hypothetical protein n=1 Tax=Streptomyces sp. NPDC059893 TaxID=3346990 RepID=UPI003650827B
MLPHDCRITVDGSGTVEPYGDGRYIAVTGRAFGASPSRLGDLQELIDELLQAQHRTRAQHRFP